jgi:ParB-like chromosome segregation protein Spo0J
MEIEKAAVDSLSLDPANARKHGKRNLDAIAASLRRFGQQKPIVVDSRGVVRAGNGTLMAAKSLGWTHVDVVRSDLAGSELAAFAIADNRTAELAEWDDEILAQFAEAGVLGELGFDEEEVGRLMNQARGEMESEELPDAKFEVVVECRDEGQQRDVFERLSSEGFSCRLFML